MLYPSCSSLVSVATLHPGTECSVVHGEPADLQRGSSSKCGAATPGRGLGPGNCPSALFGSGTSDAPRTIGSVRYHRASTPALAQ